MLKTVIVSLSFSMVLVSANATTFAVGNNILCNKYEGQILELYQGNKARVQFNASFNDGRLQEENKTEVLGINHCQKQLPDSAKVATKKLSVKDIVACNQWRGEVLSVYEGNNAKIKFTSSFNDSREQSVDVTNVFEANHCDKKLADGTEIVNGIKSGDNVLCNLWKGTVIEVFTSNRARVLFTASYNDGSEKSVSVTNLINVGHCQKQIQ